MAETGSTTEGWSTDPPQEQENAPQRDLEAQNKDNDGPGWCCICLAFIFTAGVIFLGIWFSTIFPRKPICTIEQFDLITPAGSPNSTNATRVIVYDLKLKNKNRDRGIYYDDLQLTFYYKNNPNLSSFVPIGNALFESFYQGHLRSAHRVGNLQPSGVVWEKSVAKGSFRVEVRTRVRYRNIYRYRITFWHRFRVGGNLQLNEQGSLIKGKDNKGIKLKSGANNIRVNSLWFWTVLGVLIVIALL